MKLFLVTLDFPDEFGGTNTQLIGIFSSAEKADAAKNAQHTLDRQYVSIEEVEIDTIK